jgi:hypothetical protein
MVRIRLGKVDKGIAGKLAQRIGAKLNERIVWLG